MCLYCAELTGSSDAVEWRINNKYYTATINITVYESPQRIEEPLEAAVFLCHLEKVSTGLRGVAQLATPLFLGFSRYNFNCLLVYMII